MAPIFQIFAKCGMWPEAAEVYERLTDGGTKTSEEQLHVLVEAAAQSNDRAAVSQAADMAREAWLDGRLALQARHGWAMTSFSFYSALSVLYGESLLRVLI